MSKILGIDYGSKRIGLALSDETKKVAFPCGVFENNSAVTDRVTGLINKEEIDTLVCGESFDENSKENIIMKKAREFCEKIANDTKLPIFYENEFMSSVEASRSSFVEQGKKGKQEIDASAAALILQRYLDKQEHR